MIWPSPFAAALDRRPWPWCCPWPLALALVLPLALALPQVKGHLVSPTAVAQAHTVAVGEQNNGGARQAQHDRIRQRHACFQEFTDLG